MLVVQVFVRVIPGREEDSGLRLRAGQVRGLRGRADGRVFLSRSNLPIVHEEKAQALANPTDGLVGWWKFDETSGTTAADSSGNAITGTLAGTTLPLWGIVVTGVWQHVAVTVISTGSTVTFYLNGVAYAEANPANSSSDFIEKTDRIGSYGDGEMFDGKIDDARIYNRALSASEISDLYNWRP